MGGKLSDFQTGLFSGFYSKGDKYMKVRFFWFEIRPVSGRAFDVRIVADSETDAYQLALGRYGRFALDIQPTKEPAKVKLSSDCHKTVTNNLLDF